jgi:hypothetical protein
MYADDLLLGHGRVSAAEGIVTLSLRCRLNWYRALPVSCVEHLSLTVDGTPLSADAIIVELGDRQIPAPALVEHDGLWWATGQVASLHCALGPGPVKDRYQVRLEIGTRIPYMAPMPDGSWRLARDECTAWVSA